VSPGLRIVTGDCWQAANGCISAGRASYLRWSHGKLWGRPATGGHFYACSSYLYPGAAVCGNGLVLPTTQADSGVLGSFEDQRLNAAVIAHGIREALAAIQRPPDAGPAEPLRRDLPTLLRG
jgi:hypothetical protein